MNKMNKILQKVNRKELGKGQTRIKMSKEKNNEK